MAGRRRQHQQEAPGNGCFMVIFVLVMIFSYINNDSDESSTGTRYASNSRSLTQSEKTLRQVRDESDDVIIEANRLGRMTGAVDFERGRTLVHIAAELNRYELLQKLISQGESVSPRDKKNNTPLHVAMAMKHAESVEVLLKAGADLKAATTNGYTILHHAARYGYYNVAKAALKAGANPSATAYAGWTPLHYAARENHLKIAVLLCENGADTNATIDYGWSPGDLAFSKSPDITSYLQSREARFSTRQLINEFKLVNGWPFASQKEIIDLPHDNPVFEAVAADSPTQLAELKNQGESFDIRNKAGTPVLCLALANGRLQAAGYLLKHTSDLDACDPNGKNALIYAIEGNHDVLVHEILQLKVDLSHADRSGNTALHYALAGSRNEIATELIDRGANIFAENNFSRGMIHVATENSNSLMFAILISNGCDINQEDIHGNTPLHLAVKSDNPAMVEALLKNGADFSIVNNQARTPLMLAKSDLVRNLLQNRFEIEGQNPAERALPAEVNILPPVTE